MLDYLGEIQRISIQKESDKTESNEPIKTIEELKEKVDKAPVDPLFFEKVSITAKYNGIPCDMCGGYWTLIIGGIDVSDKIPDEVLYHNHTNTNVKDGSLFTKNKYSELCGYTEEDMRHFEDGLDMEDWIVHNKHWLDTITKNKILQERIFKEIQENEFRGCDECGGCI